MCLHGLPHPDPVLDADAAAAVEGGDTADAVPPRAELVHGLVQAEEPGERRLPARRRKLGLEDDLRSRNLGQAFFGRLCILCFSILLFQ